MSIRKKKQSICARCTPVDSKKFDSGYICDVSHYLENHQNLKKLHKLRERIKTFLKNYQILRGKLKNSITVFKHLHRKTGIRVSLGQLTGAELISNSRQLKEERN